MSTPDPMVPMDSFSNILHLEQEKSFQDKTVSGGLDKFIQHWSEALLSIFPRKTVVRRLLSQSYFGMTPTQRKQWIERWLTLLKEYQGANIKDIPRPLKEQAHFTKKTVWKRNVDKGDPRFSQDIHVTKLRGVDVKTATKLAKLGISSIRDLLYLFPRRHEDYSQTAKVADLGPGQQATVITTVWEASQTRLGRGGNLKATVAVVGDETGNIRVVWFGQTYPARQLTPGTRVALSGKVGFYNRNLVLESPDYEVINNGATLIHTGRLVPVHPLTQGLTARSLRRIIWLALETWAPTFEDFMPTEILEKMGLEKLSHAIVQAHFPENFNSWERARKRLAFDELFLLQTAVQLRRQNWEQEARGIPIKANLEVVANFLEALPFSLTGAQERCLNGILADMERGSPSMSRLLQGEVGSGKTVVALASLLAIVTKGYQGSIMVPTEVLAEQHFDTVCNLMAGLDQPNQGENRVSANVKSHPKPISIGLVSGSTKKSLKRELQQSAADGSLDIVIGTHSLIQEDMELPNLALAVVDEQHRFGVMQRAALRGKGNLTPHMLIMSATPIPRTLALTLYGDLDISTIDELPVGRQKIVTKWVSQDKRSNAYGFVRKHVQSGRQAFVICPLIEESESIEAKAATEEYQRLSKEIFPDLRLGLLHGKMVSQKKDLVMSQFRRGDLDILVSTPVVEVGIDVPNATVMMVEAADRFGLAQLHQFRGRVGRGEHKSYCLLLAEDPSDLARERLTAIERIHDGFQLAEVDLSLRGSGDLFGTRQSGLPNLRMACLSDQDLLAQASVEAAKLLKNDPDLKKPKNRLLGREVARLQGQVTGETS